MCSSDLYSGILSYTFTGAGGTDSGTWWEGVESDPTNIYGAGDLSFLFQVTSNSSSGDYLASVAVASFAGFKTNVGHIPVATGAIPTSASRSGGTGSTITWTINVAPGATSDIMVVQTNAQAWKAGSLGIADSGQTGAMPAYAPAVPDGGMTVMLLGGALVLVESLRRRLRA